MISIWFWYDFDMPKFMIFLWFWNLSVFLIWFWYVSSLGNCPRYRITTPTCGKSQHWEDLILRNCLVLGLPGEWDQPRSQRCKVGLITGNNHLGDQLQLALQPHWTGTCRYGTMGYILYNYIYTIIYRYTTSASHNSLTARWNFAGHLQAFSGLVLLDDPFPQWSIREVF